MDELKTLKDLPYADKFNRNKFSVRNNYEKLYSEKDLKSSAIKWIKKLEQSYFDEKKFGINNIDGKLLRRFGAEDILRLKSIISWIKHIYNITEKDLEWD